MSADLIFFKKADEQPSYNELRDSWIETREYVIEKLQDYIDDKNSEVRQMFGWTDESMYAAIAQHRALINEVQNVDFHKSVCKSSKDFVPYSIFIQDKGLYEEIEIPYSKYLLYTDRKFFSYNETMEYLLPQQENIHREYRTFFDDLLTDIKNFWDQYKDGMICFC